jgi:hypothetical protein
MDQPESPIFRWPADVLVDTSQDAPAWRIELVEQLAALPGTDTEPGLDPAIVAGVRRALGDHGD